MPPDSDVRVPDESYINHPMPSDFKVTTTKSQLNAFKKKPEPKLELGTPVLSKLSLQQIPLNVENTPMRVVGTHVEQNIEQGNNKGIKRPSIVKVQSRLE